ncbi:MAG: hypothetical protein HY735_11280 [Verrucomicrobia bacterium]|nr:hypothetical protein [Verrucomicrobiota bacterium]
MSSKASSSLKELKGLREAVLAEEKARTQALLQNLPDASPDEPVEEQPISSSPGPPAEETDVGPSVPAPEVPRPPPPQPVPAKPPAPRPPAPTVNRAKPSKDLTLTIPLTPKFQESLQRNVENARWSPAQLVMEIMRVTLHQGYPEVRFADQVVARPGTYRTYERNPLETTLKIISGQGVFSVSVKPQNPEFQHWLAYFAEQKAPDPEKSAGQVCLFSLQSFLESMEDFRPQDWVKSISPDAFAVVPLG